MTTVEAARATAAPDVAQRAPRRPVPVSKIIGGAFILAMLGFSIYSLTTLDFSWSNTVSSFDNAAKVFGQMDPISVPGPSDLFYLIGLTLGDRRRERGHGRRERAGRGLHRTGLVRGGGDRVPGRERRLPVRHRRRAGNRRDHLDRRFCLVQRQHIRRPHPGGLDQLGLLVALAVRVDSFTASAGPVSVDECGR